MKKRKIFAGVAAAFAVMLVFVSLLAGCGAEKEERIAAEELFEKVLKNSQSASFSAEAVTSDTVLTVFDGAFDSSMNVSFGFDVPGRGSASPRVILYYSQGEKALYYVSGRTIYRLQPDDLYDRVMAVPVIGKKYAFLDPDKIPVINGKKPRKYLLSSLDVEYSPNASEDGEELVLTLKEDTASKICEFIMNVVKLTEPGRQASSAQLDKFRQQLIKALREMRIYAVVDPEELVFVSFRIVLTDPMKTLSGALKAYFPGIELPEDLTLLIELSDANAVDSVKVPEEFKKAAEDLLKHITQTLY